MNRTVGLQEIGLKEHIKNVPEREMGRREKGGSKEEGEREVWCINIAAMHALGIAGQSQYPITHLPSDPLYSVVNRENMHPLPILDIRESLHTAWNDIIAL